MSSANEARETLLKAKQGTTSLEPDSTTPLLPNVSHGHRNERQLSLRWLSCRLFLALSVIALLISVFHNHLPFFSRPPQSTPSSDLASSVLPNATLSNGTHTFHRTVILISLDGAKPAYLTPTLAPHIASLGTSTPRSRLAAYLQPIFPTLTFPNHWALLSGLYASSHGIVANDFTKASTDQQFYYTSPAHSWNSTWWLGEPIWATAERTGVSSAVLMWPGPPQTSAGAKARYFQKYETGWGLARRLHQILEWIDMDGIDERPSLICAYVPDIDQAAHGYGPESNQALAALKSVDRFVGRLRNELVEKRALGEIVDIVIVSDHGMTTTSNEKLIFLDELLGADIYSKINHRDGWPSAGLRFKGTLAQQRTYAQQAYHRLSKAKGNHSERWSQGWDVYWREDLPERYHLASATVQDRLAPLWMVPQLGWSITTNREMATFANGVYAPVGNHGYDNRESDMRAIFVASGPSFSKMQEEVGQGQKEQWNMQGFVNIQVHNLVSRILGVPERQRAPTNGTWSFWDTHLRAGL
ncbi:related to nucleotide diphosphatase [Melanopsichium pennsylvanicum]|uniref:Related to nucleotide diphosphatase n=2 Tax=Melanopsichium pennsylvanicum TaxID=63383 RepID=A0AAJ5C574_9BASI|nr:related to nucleotide diphosphatase [Melanopsichium pennsylvanicum 4]SNX84239.1 related to nucleotide diphosphatase [Melanopsichium pennsylvanicum]